MCIRRLYSALHKYIALNLYMYTIYCICVHTLFKILGEYSSLSAYAPICISYILCLYIGYLPWSREESALSAADPPQNEWTAAVSKVALWKEHCDADVITDPPHRSAPVGRVISTLLKHARALTPGTSDAAKPDFEALLGLVQCAIDLTSSSSSTSTANTTTSADAHIESKAKLFDELSTYLSLYSTSPSPLLQYSPTNTTNNNASTNSDIYTNISSVLYSCNVPIPHRYDWEVEGITWSHIDGSLVHSGY